MTNSPLFLVATIYAVRLSIISVHATIANSFSNMGGELTSGEIALIEDDTVSSKPPRAIGQALYARWCGLAT